MPNKTAPMLAPICLLLVGSLLGLSLVIAKLAIGSGAAPLPFLLLAMIGAGTVLLVAERMKMRQPFVMSPRIVEYGLVAGGLFALPNAIGFLAVAHVGAGFLSLTFAFPILITYFLSLVLGMDRFRLVKAFGVVFGLSGGIVLALSKISSGDSPWVWVVLSLTSPFIISAGNIYRTLRWPSGASSMYLAAVMLLSAGILLAPITIKLYPNEFAALFATPRIPLLLFAQTCLFSIMYLFYFILQRLAGPVYLSQIGSVAAVVGTVVSIVLLGEASPRNILLAAGLVAVGTAMFHMGSAARTRKERAIQ